MGRRSRCRMRRIEPLQLLQLESRDVPTYYGNQLFPLDNPWNQDISGAPVASNSAAILSRIASRHVVNGNPTPPRLHADFGNPNDGNLYGIPVNIATSATAKVTVVIPSFGYPDESDQVQVPIPANAVIEGDGPTGPADPSERGDSHLLVYDRDANVLYELYQAVRPGETVFPYGGNHPTGQWGAWQISYWDLNTNHFRTIGDTSADAAGLPILTGLVRPDEANPVSSGGAGVIDHAIRVTVQQTRNSFVFPASHAASSLTASDLPRMGERFRLKSTFAIPSNWSDEAKAIAQAMKTYGLIVADNGSDMFFQGLPSTAWDMDAVLQVQSIRSDQFEVVDLTPQVTSLSVSSGSTAGGTSVTITGRNFSGAAGRLHVLFGTTEAASITILSDTQVVVIAPAHAAGTVNVRVQSGETETDNEGDPIFFGYGTSSSAGSFTGDDFTFGGGSPPPPPPPTTNPKPFAVGTTGGTPARVTMYNADRTVRFTSTPFGSTVTSGIRVAVGDVTGDGVADVVVATSGGTRARGGIIDGATGAMLSRQLFGATTTYTGAVSVAVGDVDGDGTDDIAIGTNENGPHVRVLRGGTFARLSDFRAGSATGFRGRTQVALGEMTDDGKADLVVTAQYGNLSRVMSYRGGSLSPGRNPVKAFNTFQLGGGYVRGLFLGVGDVNGDGIADVVLGSAAGSAAGVAVYSGQSLIATNARVRIASFAPAGASTASGVRVAIRDIDGDGDSDLVTSSGDLVSAYRGGAALPEDGEPPLLFSFDPDTSLDGPLWVG